MYMHWLSSQLSIIKSWCHDFQSIHPSKIPAPATLIMSMLLLPISGAALAPKGSMEPPKEFVLDVDCGWAVTADVADGAKVKLGKGEGEPELEA